MSTRLQFDAERNLVTLELRDHLGASDAVAAVIELTADPRIRPGANGLIDTTDLIDLDLGGADIRRIASLAEQADARWEGGRWAVIAPRDLVYGMARMYQAIRSGAPYEIEVFRTRDEALRWLAD